LYCRCAIHIHRLSLLPDESTPYSFLAALVLKRISRQNTKPGTPKGFPHVFTLDMQKTFFRWIGFPKNEAKTGEGRKKNGTECPLLDYAERGRIS